MKRLLPLGSAIVVSFAVSGVAASQSLPERVRIFGCTEQIVQRPFAPITLPELAREAELIAEVYVTGTRSWLSSDQDQIFSDATVRLVRVWKRSAGVGDTEGATIVVRRPGGTLRIEDRVVQSFEADFPPFKSDEQYVLFLRRDPRSGAYFPAYGAQSAFRVSRGTVEQVTRAFATWNKSNGALPLASFRQLLVEQVAMLQPQGGRPGAR